MRALTALAIVLLFAILISGTNLRAAAEAIKVAMSSHERVVRPRLTMPPNSAVLVTGGAGFVGYHLCLRLHRDGVRVVALDNFDPYYSTALKRARQARLEAAGIELIEADMCDEERLSELIEQEPGFTHVASMAAQAGVRYSLRRPQAYARANVQCFLSLLEVLRRKPSVRLVYASSSSVYGSNTKIPFAEADRTDSPNSLYAATKKANEQLAHVYHGLYGLRVTGLRFFTVYGPWGRPDMAYFSFIHRMATGRSIEVYGNGRPQRDFTYVDDVVDGIVGALALGAEEEVFNLGNHRTETLGRFISVLERELGVVANKTYVGMAPGDVIQTYADVEHAAQRIGCAHHAHAHAHAHLRPPNRGTPPSCPMRSYSPHITIDEGLRRFVKWYRSDQFKAEYAEVGEWTKPAPTRGRVAGAKPAGSSGGVGGSDGHSGGMAFAGAVADHAADQTADTNVGGAGDALGRGGTG